MAVAGASDHNAGTLEIPGISLGLQFDSHFRPNRDGIVAAKFDAILANVDVSRREIQTRCLRLNRDGLEQPRVTNFACAHKFV